MGKKEERSKIISGLEIRVITEVETDCVLEFLAKNYSRQNPLREIFDTNTDRAFAMDQQRIRAKVDDGVSIGIFVKKTNELVGVGMNSVLTKTKRESEPEFSDLNKKEQAMLDFVNFMEGDIFKDLKAENIFWLSMASIAENYRGLNLASLGNPIREKLAASKGCEYLATLTVSDFSQRATAKQGFRTLREMNYSDYVDTKTGLKPDLKLSPIHTRAAVMYKRVEAPKSISSKL